MKIRVTAEKGAVVKVGESLGALMLAAGLAVSADKPELSLVGERGPEVRPLPKSGETR